MKIAWFKIKINMLPGPNRYQANWKNKGSMKYVSSRKFKQKKIISCQKYKYKILRNQWKYKILNYNFLIKNNMKINSKRKKSLIPHEK